MVIFIISIIIVLLLSSQVILFVACYIFLCYLICLVSKVVVRFSLLPNPFCLKTKESPVLELCVDSEKLKARHLICSSVTIRLELDDRGKLVRFSAETKDLNFFQSVQVGSAAQSAYTPTGF